ncbi:MAG: Ig-like domain-containing protein [Chitinispirillia bacterium]|nr:Ig-like domain-containing protein [Chitinispirillia bacterium]MCL2268944.1 Ig-like domain-containing protein [Chitinispirillia bacterium]
MKTNIILKKAAAANSARRAGAFRPGGGARGGLAVLFLAAALFFCANQGAPGGGPVDKEPPSVAVSSPAAGQVNVNPRAPVTVAFSEWINTASAKGAVSVYPPLAGGFDVRASKNRLAVVPKESFGENTTYHLVIGTALQDLRGNGLAAPVNIVFSTGAELDSGRLAGAVVPFGALVTVPRVALYFEGDGWEDGRYFAVPDYALPVDSAGAFSFSNLREGRYRAVAFTDQFRIGRLRVGDPVFTSHEQVIAVTKAERFVRLYPSDSDTATVPRVLQDTLPPKFLKSLPDSPTSHSPELRLVWTMPVRVSLSMVTAEEVRDVRGVIDTVGIDTAVVDTLQKAAAAPPDSVVFFFAAADGHSDTTRLAPSRRLLPGTTYKLRVPVQAVKAVNGVTAADSAVVTIKTIPADSVCYRLQGGADCLEPDDKRKWVYRPTGRGDVETFTVADKAGTFTFDSIPASKGTLMWFIDDNNDNRLTTGKLIPWRAPERFFTVPDTIQAKARWEVENIQVEACE